MNCLTQEGLTSHICLSWYINITLELLYFILSPFVFPFVQKLWQKHGEAFCYLLFCSFLMLIWPCFFILFLFLIILTHHSNILKAASQLCYVLFSLGLYCCCIHRTLMQRNSHCGKVVFVCLFALSITKCVTIRVQNTFQALVQKERARLIFIAIFHVFPLMIDGHYIWPHLTTNMTSRWSDWPLQKSVPAQGNCRVPWPAIFLTHSPQFQNTCDLPRTLGHWSGTLHSIEMPQLFFFFFAFLFMRAFLCVLTAF